MSVSPVHRFQLGVIVIILACSPIYCQTTQGSKKSSNSKKTESPKDLQKKIHKIEQDLKIAQLELEMATISITLKERKAAAGIRSATFASTRAKQALHVFDTSEAPVKIKEAQIGVDQAKNRAELARDELNELIAMYKADEFAEMTKELVLKRGRKNLEFAERRLAVQLQKLERLKTIDLPRKREDLANKVENATESLFDAKLSAKKTKLENTVASIKANNKIADLQLQLGEAKGKLAKTTVGRP